MATDIVLRVIHALEKLSIPYMLVGSYSSNLYGQARLTNDADFVLQLESDKIKPLRDQLAPDLLLDPQMSFETMTMTLRHIARHVASPFKVELFLLSDDAHDQARFTRRRLVDFEGTPTWLPSPEDVVITKLRWSKDAKRKKDVIDIEQVLRVRGDKLDLSYIREWCDKHGTRAVFEQLFEESKRFHMGFSE